MLGAALPAQYFLADALGSVRQLAHQGRGVTFAQAYEPFGDPLLAAGRERTPYGFTGEWTDATGLVHLRARYYDPEVGRFFQKDPSGLESNTYLFVGANPIVKVDPTGLFSVARITQSFGQSTLWEVMDWIETRDTKYPRWGFLQLLLDAEGLDRVYGISLETFGRATHVPMGLFLVGPDCAIRVFADRLYSLPEYVEGMPEIAKRMRPLDIPPWRTVVHRYSLNRSTYYRDTHRTDLPDYFSLALGAKVRWVEGGSAMIVLVSDRFGKDYIGLSAGVGLGVGLSAFEYREGYFSSLKAEAGTGHFVPLGEDELRSAILGIDVGVSGSLAFVGVEGSVNLDIPPYLEASFFHSIADLIGISGSVDITISEINIRQTTGWIEPDTIAYSNRGLILHSTSGER